MSYYLITVLIVLVILYCYVAYSEYKDFNKGICPKCGKELELLTLDSQGGRCYYCKDCKHYVWVSWLFVDKNYLFRQINKK